jgi:hypothetical protein
MEPSNCDKTIQTIQNLNKFKTINMKLTKYKIVPNIKTRMNISLLHDFHASCPPLIN